MKKYKNRKDKSVYNVNTPSIIEVFEKDKNFVEIKENEQSDLVQEERKEDIKENAN